jgi:hypothetical protein
MQKITEIPEHYTVNRKDNATGEYITSTLTKFREVPYVNGWPRLAHAILDVVFYFIFAFIFYFSIGVILTLLGSGEQLIEHIDNYERLYSWLFIHPFFYFIFELSLQSSPEKAILGRVVVDEYGNKPSVKQLLIRSYSRAVPFEVFSCLSDTGWHDRWSRTFVLRKNDLKELLLLQKIGEIEPEKGK